MYVAKHSKSYKRDLDELRSKSYRRNLGPLPPGTTALASSLLSSKVMSDASDLFRKGKKSKLARELASKRKNNPTDAEIKHINSRLSSLTDKGYYIKVNLPYINIQDPEGREWNTDIDSVNST